MRDSMAELIDRSSLGTAGAKRLRSRTPSDVIERLFTAMEREAAGRGEPSGGAPPRTT